MKPKIATYGNLALNINHGIAADLTLAGYDVSLCDSPRFQEIIAPIQKLGGINITGNPDALTSGRTGFAKIKEITTDIENAVSDADVLFVDLPPHDLESRFEEVAPFIRDGAVVNFNSYGYWPSLRVAGILNKYNKKNVMLSETPAPFYVARGSNGTLDFMMMRKGIPLSVFPARKSREAFDVLYSLYPSLVMAKNVLQTNFENLNMMGHAGIALLNIAYFDRAKEHGETTAFFYGTGITKSTGLLSQAQDEERIAACRAYDVLYFPYEDSEKQYYGGSGDTLAEIQLNCDFTKNIPAYDCDMWKKWLSIDVPLAMVPFVSLCDLADVDMPVHKGLIHIFGAILENDFMETGLTLERLGLENMTKDEVIGYVTEG